MFKEKGKTKKIYDLYLPVFFVCVFIFRSCYDAFTENMAGESQLLEKRRQYHCAAYNCAIAVISCVFTETKFYQGFLFTEKAEKVRSYCCC